MAEREAGEGGAVEGTEAVAEDVLEAEGRAGGLAVGAAAEDEAGHLLQLSAERELREHPVDAVGRFLDVLEEENRAVGVDLVRRSHQRRDEGQVAAGEPSGGLAR